MEGDNQITLEVQMRNHYVKSNVEEGRVERTGVRNVQMK